jgi:hypothetical protein
MTDTRNSPSRWEGRAEGSREGEPRRRPEQRRCGDLLDAVVKICVFSFHPRKCKTRRVPER